MADKKEDATKTYKVASGKSITRIEDGRRKAYSAGSEIELTEAQAGSFKDKLDGEVDGDGNILQIRAGHDRGDSATINEAAAKAGEDAETDTVGEGMSDEEKAAAKKQGTAKASDSKK